MLRTAIGAVWNGPFNIGPLAQPVTMGSAIIKILDVAWKGAVLVFGALALIGAGAAINALIFSGW